MNVKSLRRAASLCYGRPRSMRARHSVTLSVLVALAAAIGGCKSENTLGGDCTLVKKAPGDAGTSVAIKESEINAGLQKDFVSFGSIECEDFVCTRDPGFPRDGGTGNAHGYCSKPCATNDNCKTGDDALDRDPKRRLVCRALLLDEATLGQICELNPADCQTYFGGTRSPYFCARQLNVTDGGN